MPASVPWIGPRLGRTLFLLFATIAGLLAGDLLFGGRIGALIGAFIGFTIAIQRSPVRRLRREQLELQSWEQERVKGKTRFVRRTALTYGLTMVGAAHVYNSFLGGTEPVSLFKLIFFVLCGIVVGSHTWSTMEAKYEDALRKARAKALPGNEPLPQPGQVFQTHKSSNVVL